MINNKITLIEFGKHANGEYGKEEFWKNWQTHPLKLRVFFSSGKKETLLCRNTNKISQPIKAVHLGSGVQPRKYNWIPVQ